MEPEEEGEYECSSSEEETEEAKILADSEPEDDLVGENKCQSSSPKAEGNSANPIDLTTDDDETPTSEDPEQSYHMIRADPIDSDEDHAPTERGGRGSANHHHGSA